MNLGQTQKVAISNTFSYGNGSMLGSGARWERVGIFPAKDYSSVFLDHTRPGPVSSRTLESSGRNCVSIVLDGIDRFHRVSLVKAYPSITITPGSRLTCARCHGIGYVSTALGKLPCPTCSASEVSNRQDHLKIGKKCLALVQHKRTISENSAGLASGSPLRFDFSVDGFKDRAVVEKSRR